MNFTEKKPDIKFYQTRWFFALSIITVIVGYVLIGLQFCDCEKHTYQVKIEFCDNREPVIADITWQGEAPTRKDIRTYHEAVPNFSGFMNVCNVETLQKIK